MYKPLLAKRCIFGLSLSARVVMDDLWLESAFEKLVVLLYFDEFFRKTTPSSFTNELFLSGNGRPNGQEDEACEVIDVESTWSSELL